MPLPETALYVHRTISTRNLLIFNHLQRFSRIYRISIILALFDYLPHGGTVPYLEKFKRNTNDCIEYAYFCPGNAKTTGLNTAVFGPFRTFCGVRGFWPVCGGPFVVGIQSRPGMPTVVSCSVGPPVFVRACVRECACVCGCIMRAGGRARVRVRSMQSRTARKFARKRAVFWFYGHFGINPHNCPYLCPGPFPALCRVSWVRTPGRMYFVTIPGKFFDFSKRPYSAPGGRFLSFFHFFCFFCIVMYCLFKLNDYLCIQIGITTPDEFPTIDPYLDPVERHGDTTESNADVV